jgi:hypothetical protein
MDQQESKLGQNMRIMDGKGNDLPILPSFNGLLSLVTTDILTNFG